MVYKLHFSNDVKTHAQMLVQDHTRGRVGIWTQYSFRVLAGLRLLLSCIACLPNRWIPLGGQGTCLYLFGTHLTVFSVNTGAGVDRTSSCNGIILYRRDPRRAALSPNAGWSVETWGADSPSKACRPKNNVVTGLADNERQRAVLLNTAQSDLSLPAQPSRLLKGPQKAAGEMTRA